jgi:hypothetical protein
VEAVDALRHFPSARGNDAESLNEKEVVILNRSGRNAEGSQRQPRQGSSVGILRAAKDAPLRMTKTESRLDFENDRKDERALGSLFADVALEVHANFFLDD